MKKHNKKNQFTVAGLVETTGCSRQHVNRVCRQLFGPSNAYRRTFTLAEYTRLIGVFRQHTRRNRLHLIDRGKDIIAQ